MRKTITVHAFAFLSTLLMLVSGHCFAKTESYADSLKGPFAVNATYTKADPNYALSYVINQPAQNTVTLQVLDNVLISTAFTCTLALRVDYYTYATNTLNTTYPSLTVNYVPGQGLKYKGLDVYSFTGAYKIQVTVLSSAYTGSTPPANSLQLRSDVIVDRTYTFSAAQSISATYAWANNAKQLQVNWSAINSAEEYDVEWTTINNGNTNYATINANLATHSSPDVLSATLAQTFRNNSSRITTKGTNCSIDVLSNDNILLVRIRQAQYNPATGLRTTGNWDYTNGVLYAIWAITWNEQTQNWQYSSAFAEDGKKKEVISYFDGTLRGRQTVTMNNTDNVAIAQENIYDEFGRPSASILPAPYKEPTLTPYLHYLANFNVNAAGTPYNYANVIGTAVACELNPDPLKTSIGASRYYSSLNDFKSLNTAYNYIPDAAGYPLSVTQYTADNTGRIKSQGGVGLAFQPGKSGSPLQSKTTKYYYGKPEQWELDQLFANDAGYAEHYLKNMVVDPNGQISISYLNASGKTVATALAGQAPSMLDTLPSYQSVQSNTKPQNLHILKPEQFIYNSSALTLNANTTYLASVVGTDTLKFNIQRLINHYPGTFQICSNCYYKMTVKVSDDCGNTTAAISTPVQIGDATSTCADTALYQGSLVVPIQQPGEYNVSIQFAFDNNVIQAYADNFVTQGISNNYLEQQFNYIKKRYLDSLDVSGCYSDCHTCTVLLGSQTDFVSMLKSKCIALGLDSIGVIGSSFNTWANALYTSLKSNCTAMQASCTYSPCSAIQGVMQDDVSPGGQYALFDNTGAAVEPDINVITQVLPSSGGKQNWRVIFPVLPSTDPIYKANQIVKPDGTVTSPNDVNFGIPDLITYWQPAWAILFLPYHPEYCKLQYCNNNITYESWDMRVQQDFNKASDVPSIPTGGAPLSYKPTNSSDWLLSGDPFFKTGAPGNAYLSQMSGDLLNYSKNVLHVPGAPIKGLIKYDDYQLYCSDKTGNTNTGLPIDSNWTQCTPLNTCRVADREWTAYREHYFEVKQKYYTLLRNALCGTPACPVGQVDSAGMPGSCPVASDFSIKPYSGANSCGAGNQTVAVIHNAGTLSKFTALNIYYPSSLDNSSLPHVIPFNAGDAQETFCVPSGFPVGSIRVKAASCAANGYGNDPSYVVKVINTKVGVKYTACTGDTTHSTDTLYYTSIALTDSYGNPAYAMNPVSVVLHYTYPTCPGTPSTVTMTIPFGQSAGGYYPYLKYISSKTYCIPVCPAYLDCAASITNVSHIQGLATCAGFTITNPQPPTNSCPPGYATKTARFPDQTSTVADQAAAHTIYADSTIVKAASVAAVKAQAADICAGTATMWISKLQPGLNAMHGGSGATPTELSNLTSALISICSAGGDQAHPTGASSLPPGASGTYADFGAAIKSILLGGGNFTSTLNPWLIDAPAPYSVPQQAIAKTISNSNSPLCSLLQTYTTQATAAGQTLYNYLVSTYGSAMTLTSANVDTLTKSCGNCKFILGNDITLPVFLDPGSQGCVTRTAYNSYKAGLSAQFGGSLPTTDPNYPTILSNYINQHWGFSLTYDDYTAFEAGTATQICNSLPYGNVDADPYDCVKNAVAKAVNNGLADYNAYIALQRQNFIASYINTCKLAKANANLVAVQQQYHYTLYYYDQADNLARTVPPEGVTLIDTSLFNYIDKARDLDTAAYTYTYNGPTTASSLSTALTTLSATLSASVGSVEMWLYNNGAANYHWVEATTDKKYLYQVGLAGSNLSIDVYPLTQPDATSTKFVPVSAHYHVNIGSILPLTPFTHVVMQGSNLGAGSSLPQIYVNGKSFSVSSAAGASPFGFKVSGGASTVTYPDSIQSLKHLRLYNHLLTSANIKADANNIFFSAKDLTYTGWYRFNVPAPGAPPTTINSTTSDEVAVYDTYPAHVLPTTYAYNGTNQVTQQNSPDGGTNRFWYDLLSRLAISQNDKQNPGNNYSYTAYDAIGRITEVGQKTQATVSLGTPDYLTDATIQTFAAAGSNSQITHTYYDSPVPTVSGNTDGIATLPQQSNLRKRVAASTYADTQAGPVLRATYYNYDLDGNVKTLWQQVDGLYQNSSNTGLKRIDYEYDLVSGKVNTVRYQDGQPDAFYYNYGYDAENRLTAAWSSTSAITDTLTGTYLPTGLKKMDAQYYYYLHGPLRRLELGDDNGKVQGVDYAYTLQGWLKGVNSSTVQSSKDMGRDSLAIPRDAYGYTLYYYGNGSTISDYTPIGGTNPFATTPPGLSSFNGLYNGNIAAISNNITKLADPWHYYTYRYDQLNRIKASHVYKAGSTATSVADYHEAFTYDGNGNIKNVSRYAGAATVMDSLTYNYNTNNGRLINNRLNYINDAVTTPTWPYGLDNQAVNNYTYDAIGNMTADVTDTVSNINWTVYNKIQNLTNSKGTISYTYNPAGQRVSKTLNSLTTYYIRDAQGNTLALYDNKSGNVNWREQELYGSSRLGMWQPNVNLSTSNAQAVWDTIGNKEYELTNHLGNVLATITDKRLQHASGAAITYFDADVATAQEYYAGGMSMPGRSYIANTTAYRYGYQGSEKDQELNNDTYTTLNRELDTRINRWFSIDPQTASNAGQSPYVVNANNPIIMVDPLGDKEYASLAAYTKETGRKQLGKSDWLTSDRISKSGVWDAANTYNTKNNIQNQYAPYEQVRDYYSWVQDKATSLGHEVKWMKGAMGLVGDLAATIEPGSKLEDAPNAQLKVLLQDLNIGIQNGTMRAFNDLLFGKYSKTPLKGAAAQSWDEALVNYEQGQVAPGIYAHASPVAIQKMQQTVDRTPFTWAGNLGFIGSNVPPFKWFNAKVTDTQIRIDVPLLMMYPNTYRPKWKGFEDKVNSQGHLQGMWRDIFKHFQVK